MAAIAENSGGAPVTVKCRIGVDGMDFIQNKHFIDVGHTYTVSKQSDGTGHEAVSCTSPPRHLTFTT